MVGWFANWMELVLLREQLTSFFFFCLKKDGGALWVLEGVYMYICTHIYAYTYIVTSGGVNYYYTISLLEGISEKCVLLLSFIFLSPSLGSLNVSFTMLNSLPHLAQVKSEYLPVTFLSILRLRWLQSTAKCVRVQMKCSMCQ